MRLTIYKSTHYVHFLYTTAMLPLVKIVFVMTWAVYKHVLGKKTCLVWGVHKY